jgi:O-antigen ligase/tetratricopeptide (TPR) repeat protein
MRGAATWARRRTPLEWAALAGGAAVAAYVGWDAALWDPRIQLLLHLIGAGAVALLVLAATRGQALPRTPLELPLLALLAAYALATAGALNHGMSLRAMASVTGYALALPIAIAAIRHRPTWVGLIASVPVLAYAAPTLLALLWRRIEWIVVGAPGLPPLRLPAEGSLFGSVAVPPFVIWPAWALAGLIEDARWRKRVQWSLASLGVPLTLLSGSRSAWLAVAATGVVVGLPWAWRHRRHLRPMAARPSAALLIGGIGLASTVIVGVLVVPRLTAVTSLLYRVDLWRDTLTAWASDPITGIGPGFMPFARQAAAADYSFPVRQPHSHNVPLGVLGDAGLIGFAAGLFVVVALAVTVGPWRARSPVARGAALVLFGLAIGSLFEDLTFLPNFNLLAIGLVATVLLDVGVVRWERLPTLRGPIGRLLALGTVPMVLVLGAAAVTADAGGIAYRMGQDAGAREDWGEAARWLERSEALDPWQPATPKALAVAAAEAGMTRNARQAAERAVVLNPGDGASWTNLALLCAPDDDRCVRRALDQAVRSASFGTDELANAALLYDGMGEHDLADDAYRRSLLAERLTAFALDWPRAVTLDGWQPVVAGSQAELNRVIAGWAVGDPVAPGSVDDVAVRALAHLIVEEDVAARSAARAAMAATPDDPLSWEIGVVILDTFGEPIDRELRIAEVVRGAPLAVHTASRISPSLTLDLASWRAVPGDGLVPGARRLRTDPPWPWILARLASR